MKASGRQEFVIQKPKLNDFYTNFVLDVQLCRGKYVTDASYPTFLYRQDFSSVLATIACVSKVKSITR